MCTGATIALTVNRIHEAASLELHLKVAVGTVHDNFAQVSDRASVTHNSLCSSVVMLRHAHICHASDVYRPIDGNINLFRLNPCTGCVGHAGEVRRALICIHSHRPARSTIHCVGVRRWGLAGLGDCARKQSIALSMA